MNQSVKWRIYIDNTVAAWKAAPPTTTGAVITLTDECNYDCAYCLRRHHSPNPVTATADELIVAVGKLIDCGANSFILSGGEPLLEWTKIRALLEAYPNTMFELITNGALLDREKMSVIATFPNVSVTHSFDGNARGSERYRTAEEVSRAQFAFENYLVNCYAYPSLLTRTLFAMLPSINNVATLYENFKALWDNDAVLNASIIFESIIDDSRVWTDETAAVAVEQMRLVANHYVRAIREKTRLKLNVKGVDMNLSLLTRDKDDTPPLESRCGKITPACDFTLDTDLTYKIHGLGMLESRDTVVGGDGAIDAGVLKTYLNTLLTEHANDIDAECEGCVGRTMTPFYGCVNSLESLFGFSYICRNQCKLTAALNLALTVSIFAALHSGTMPDATAEQWSELLHRITNYDGATDSVKSILRHLMNTVSPEPVGEFTVVEIEGAYRVAFFDRGVFLNLGESW